MNCGTCKYYRVNEQDKDKKSGNCYIEPPTVHFIPMPVTQQGMVGGKLQVQQGVAMQPASVRPMVLPTHFCQYWQPLMGVKGN